MTTQTLTPEAARELVKPDGEGVGHNAKERMNSTKLYELWNTSTEEVEGVQRMTEEQARQRNSYLIADRAPQRWIVQVRDDED